MKLLAFIPSPFYSPLSMNNYVRAMALEELAENLKIVTFPHGEDINNLKIIRIPNFKIFNNLENGQYLKILIYTFLMFIYAVFIPKKKYDFIFLFGSMYLFFWLLKAFTKSKIIATSYSQLENEIEKWNISRNNRINDFVAWYDTFILKKYHKVIVQSSELYSHYLNKGISKKSLVLIKQSFYCETRLNANRLHPPFTVLYTGSFVSVQNIDMIYEIAELMLGDEKVNFALVGANAEEIGKHLKKVQERKLTNVKILPRCKPNQVRKYIEESSILISTRTFGSDTPIKIFEYLAAGKCIIATDLPIHNNVLNDKIAVLVEPNAESFANKINILIERPQLLNNYSERAYRFFKENYSYEIMKRNYQKLLMDV